MAHLSLQVLECEFVLQPQLSDGFKKKDLFSVCTDFSLVLRMGVRTSKLFDTLERKQNRLAFFCIKSFYQFLFEVTIGRAWAQTTSKGSFPRCCHLQVELGVFHFQTSGSAR